MQILATLCTWSLEYELWSGHDFWLRNSENLFPTTDVETLTNGLVWKPCVWRFLNREIYYPSGECSIILTNNVLLVLFPWTRSLLDSSIYSFIKIFTLHIRLHLLFSNNYSNIIWAWSFFVVIHTTFLSWFKLEKTKTNARYYASLMYTHTYCAGHTKLLVTKTASGSLRVIWVASLAAIITRILVISWFGWMGCRTSH